MLRNDPEKRGRDVISRMFLPAALVMIFTQVTGVVANIIDGVITSRFLGSDAYSAVSLLDPMVNIILLLAGFVSIGGQIVCANRIGKGERKEADAIFTLSIVFGLLIAVFFILMSVFSPRILFHICGVKLKERPELFEYMLQYLRGYAFGIPAVILTQVLSPYIVMDNGKRLVTISAAFLCAANIAGDLLNALVLHGGVFGMGLATAVAMWIQLVVLILHFVKGTSFFRFTLSGLTVSNIKDVVMSGSLTFIKRLAVILRDIATNRINLIIAVSSAAVAAKCIQSDLNMLMFCISIGTGRTLLTISSMYYGAEDKEGVKRCFTTAMALGIKISMVTGIILFFAAPLVSRIYTSVPDVLELSVFSLRCMSLGLVLDCISEIYQDYLQSIQNRKMVNFLCFSERLFIPVAMAALMGALFGSKGVLASFVVGKALLILLMFIYLCVRNRGIPRHVEDYMFLPEGFGGKERDNIDVQIISMDDVMRESRSAADFCLAHGLNEKQSRLMSMFVEEMAGNIVQHGKPRGRDKVCVDYKLHAGNGRISLCFRDYCEQFDPMQFYEIHSNDSLDEYIGIRMVMKLAKDIRYISTFNSNCLIINMEME